MSHESFRLPLYREDASRNEIVYSVEVSYSRDPGCRTMPNGDPGWPPSEDIDIGQVFDASGKVVDLDLTEKEVDRLSEAAAEKFDQLREDRFAREEDAKAEAWEERREARRDRE